VAGQDHMKVLLLGREAGLDPLRIRYVPFDGGGEALTALLGGFVQVFSGEASEVESHLETGAIRVLGVLSPQPLDGLLAGVPTAAEQGYPVEWVTWRGFYVPGGLDDEAYRELWFDEPPPQALSAMAQGYGVITVGSFSKTVATGIRIGWIHARPEILALFGRMRFAMGQNQLGLRAFGEFLDREEYDPHLERVRALYRRKRDLLHAALLQAGLDRYLEWQPPAGGFYIWAQLKGDMDAQALWRTAVEEGIAVNNGAGFSPAEAPANCIRIAYAWTPVEEFAEAARRLRLACDRVAAGNAAGAA